MIEKYANLKNFRIHYLEGGTGECIVLLPSLWVTSKSYKFFGEKLEDKFKVIIPDLGNTEKSSGKKLLSSLEDYFLLLDEFLENIGINRFFLLGFSVSGMIAVGYASKFPHKVKGLFLLSTTLVPVKMRMTLLRGLVRGYFLLVLDNLRYQNGLKVDLLWLKDGFVDFVKHPRQFIKDGLIAVKNLKEGINKIEIPNLLLLPTV